jgi:hypothetical protein
MTRRRQEDVHAGVSVHRVLLLRVLNGSDDLAADLDHVAKS